MNAKKHLGQHFLRCYWVSETMTAAAELNAGDTILEVGAGKGALTRELAKRGGLIIAIEKDRTLVENLKNALQKEGIRNVRVVSGDVLRLLESGFLPGPGLNKNYKVISSIPYYLSSRLLRLLLEKESRPKTIVLTVQKELAQRVTARPPKMNLLAVSVRVFGKPEIVKTVPAECFSPKPKVESAILKISDISDAGLRRNRIGPDEFFAVAKALFSGRRKIILNNLSKLTGKKTALSLLEKAGISHNIRAGELDLDDLINLAKIFSAAS